MATSDPSILTNSKNRNGCALFSMDNVILWEDAEPVLEDRIFRKAHHWIKNYPWPLVERFSTEEYISSYTLVYTLCTQKPPHNYSEKCHKFIGDMAEKYAMRPGLRRNAFIKYVTGCFKYLDRFYVRRLELPGLDEYMDRVMDRATPTPQDIWKAQLHLVKKAFKKWACDEDLLGHTHADGGVAKKREREWWDENAVDEGKKACASE